MINKENYYLSRKSGDFDIDWNNDNHVEAFELTMDYLITQSKYEKSGVVIPELKRINNNLKAIVGQIIVDNKSKIDTEQWDLSLLKVDDSLRNNEKKDIFEKEVFSADLGDEKQRKLFRISMNYLRIQTSYEVYGDIADGFKKINQDFRNKIEMILSLNPRFKISKTSRLEMGLIDGLSDEDLMAYMTNYYRGVPNDINTIAKYFWQKRNRN